MLRDSCLHCWVCTEPAVEPYNSTGIKYKYWYMATFPRDYRITVFATCHSIRRVQTGLSSSASLSYSSDSDRSYLCRSWQRLVTHRLMCFRQEAANNTSDEAGSSIQQRIQQVFRIHCISSFSSSGSKPYKTNSFYVTDAGVEFTSVWRIWRCWDMFYRAWDVWWPWHSELNEIKQLCHTSVLETLSEFCKSLEVIT